MKTITLTVLLALVCLSFNVAAQHPTELTPGYYTVVAAYAPSRENVAKNYTEVLTRRGFKAAYGFNSSRKYFFVYLRYFDNLKESLRDMQSTRKLGEEFSEAWVRVIPGEIKVPAPVAANVAPEEKSKTAEPAPSPETAVTTKSPAVADSQPTTTGATFNAEAAEEVEITYNPEIKQYKQMTLGNTEVFLSLFNSRNNRIIDGTVRVIDTERTRFIQEVKGNEYLNLPDPKTKTGQLTLICEVFGYRKIQHEINYPLPLADTVKDYIDLMGTTLVVNFDLVRYHKGDIGTLFNVYFYNDAALLLPESKYQLTTLKEMMDENPHYRIRLHGHTNGNYHGRILTMGENKNLFSLDGAKSGVGSAKDLSYNRALIIKEYLVENGVDGDRIEIKAWGGKRPIFDRHGANAKKNVRVEVEVLDE